MTERAVSMSNSYNFKEIEEKWQKKWREDNSFKAEIDKKKEKYYVLEMFPYPSGKLHMGHVRNYAIDNAITRYKSLKGTGLNPNRIRTAGSSAENATIMPGTTTPSAICCSNGNRTAPASNIWTALRKWRWA